MRKNELLVDKFHLYKRKKLLKSLVIFLSCFVFIFTFYFLISRAITKNNETIYKLNLIDSYNSEDYSWKKDNYTTSFSLNLHYVDTNGNNIDGKDLTIDIGPNSLEDDPYGFGYVPYAFDSNEEFRGQNIIDALNMNEYTLSTGELYKFDHAEVLVDGVWQTFNDEGRRWHIFCQGSGSTEESIYYGWRGTYGKDNNVYIVNSNTEYKLVYKKLRYGVSDTVSSVGIDSGITFKMFNYSGRNDLLDGDNNINNNGVYDYFSFRGLEKEIYGENNINESIDSDGFLNDTRAKVKSTLNENKNPVFDCRNFNNCTDFSLGYLFGEETNPLGESVKGVTAYNPTNTLLQKDSNGNYYYDSNLNAVDYDTVNNRFMVRNYKERGYDTSEILLEANRYEFLPFNYWNDSSKEKINTLTSLSYQYDDLEIDHWYGMTMEFNFYMPKDGKINNSDMIFNFSGDDDVWVFIDDVLVLDLGGTHGAVNGTINFATGEVKSYLNWNGEIGTPEDKTGINTNIYQMYENASSIDKTLWNNNTFEYDTYHTLKLFYLERGASVSNCLIKFNMPILPPGTLSVKKEFNGIDKYNDDYEFTLYDVTNKEKVPVSNTKYTIDDKEYYTDINGKFTLKSNEMALFTLNNNHKYYVEESSNLEHSQSYSCTLNKISCPSINKTEEFIMHSDSIYNAVFTNEIKKLNLNINKIVYLNDDNDTFEFNLTLKDKENNSVDIPDSLDGKYVVDHTNGVITFNLKNNESVTIKDIPIDTLVTLKEINYDGYDVIIKSKDIVLANGNILKDYVLDLNKDITVYNTPSVMLPETGGNGIIWYLLSGISLMFISIKFGYKYLFNINKI